MYKHLVCSLKHSKTYTCQWTKLMLSCYVFDLGIKIRENESTTFYFMTMNTKMAVCKIYTIFSATLNAEIPSVAWINIRHQNSNSLEANATTSNKGECPHPFNFDSSTNKTNSPLKELGSPHPHSSWVRSKPQTPLNRCKPPTQPSPTKRSSPS